VSIPNLLVLDDGLIPRTNLFHSPRSFEIFVDEFPYFETFIIIPFFDTFEINYSTTNLSLRTQPKSILLGISQ